MKDINKLVVITTPFHKMVVKEIFPNIMNEATTLVLYSEFVDVDDIFVYKKLLLNHKFSRSDLFSNPIKNLNKTREKLRRAKGEVDNIFREFIFSNELEVVICSDKDVFTQLLLNKLFKVNKKRRLIAIEEGLGFYVKTVFKDKIFALLYQIITPVLFGSRLYYIRRLGSYPHIDTIYVRDLSLLPKEVKKKSMYKEFKCESRSNKKVVSNGTYLFFSFPEQDYQMNPEIKYKLISDIAKFAKSKNKNLVVKPHPRETIDIEHEKLISKSNIVILDREKLGEGIDYFDYEIIINFFSSIIVDILANKYPKKRLFTIGIAKKPIVDFRHELKYVALNNLEIEKYINL